MTVPLPLQVQIAPVGGGSWLNITRWCTDLQYGSRYPGGMAEATWTYHGKLSELGDEYGWFSPVRVHNTATAEDEYLGLLDDPGRYSGPDGEMFRMSASGYAACTKWINRPRILIDSSLESWPAGVAPFMREQIQRTADNNTTVAAPPNSEEEGGEEEGPDPEDVEAWKSGPGVVLAAPEGTLFPEAQGIGYVHYLPAIQSGQLINSLLVIDVTKGQDSDFTIGYTFGLDSLPPTFNASHAASPTATLNVLLSGVDFGFANVVALAWTRSGDEVVAGQDCWTRFGSPRLKPIMVDRFGDVLAGSPPGWTTWREVVGDLIGSGLIQLADGDDAYLDDDLDGPAPQPIYHQIYPDQVNPDQIMADLLQIESWATWFMFGTTFYWTPKPNQITFECDSAYEALDCPGSTGDTWSGVGVRFKDQLGNTQTAYVADDQAAALEAAGIVKETVVDLGDNMWASPAQIGGEFLAGHAHPVRSGTLTISRRLFNVLTSEWWEPWELPRHGPFRVRVAGASGGTPGTVPDGVTVFDVVGVRFDANTCSAVCDLDESAPARWTPQTTIGRLPR